MFISNEDILNNITTIEGWVCEEDSMVGSIYFYNERTKMAIFATPNWDEDGYVPFAIQDENGEYDAISFSLKLEGSIEEQLSQYVSQIQLITSQLR